MVLILKKTVYLFKKLIKKTRLNNFALLKTVFLLFTIVIILRTKLSNCGIDNAILNTLLTSGKCNFRKLMYSKGGYTQNKLLNESSSQIKTPQTKSLKGLSINSLAFGNHQ